MNGTPRPGEYIAEGSIFDYGDGKVNLGSGTFGLVFGTRVGPKRVAIKIQHVPKAWKTKLGQLEREVIPLSMSARKLWKNVSWADKAFVHENLRKDLDAIKRKGIGSQSPDSSENRFWIDIGRKLLAKKR